MQVQSKFIKSYIDDEVAKQHFENNNNYKTKAHPSGMSLHTLNVQERDEKKELKLKANKLKH